MSSPAPVTRSPAAMAQPARPVRPSGPKRAPAAAAPTLRLARSVSITTTAAGAASRRRLPGRGDFVPHAAVHVDAVAVCLARGAVGGVGVQRVLVVGGLIRAVGPGDRVALAGDARRGGYWPGQRRKD